MNGTRVPSPREWVGAAAYPWPPASRLEHGERVNACYGVLFAAPQSDGAMQLTLADARGRVQGRIEDARRADWIQTGIYVGVRGFFDAGGETILIEEIAPVRVTLDDLPLFLPGPSRDAAEMDAELESAIASVEEDNFRLLLETLLSPASEAGQGFRLAPAATRNHHAHLGGLLEHTLSVTAICHYLAAHYGDVIDRDLLITAALLHDIGKVREIGAQAGFAYTDEGRLLGHILLGLRMVRDGAAGLDIPEPRMLLLEHLIASHQGRYEWQSPREPRTLEALLLHYADDLDAKFDPARTSVLSVERGWSERDRVRHHEWLNHRTRPDLEPKIDDSAAADGGVTEDAARDPAERTARGGVKGRKPGPKTGRARKKPKRRKKATRSSRKAARARSSRNAANNAADAPVRSESRRDMSQPSTIPLDPHTIDMFS